MNFRNVDFLVLTHFILINNDKRRMEWLQWRIAIHIRCSEGRECCECVVNARLPTVLEEHRRNRTLKWKVLINYLQEINDEWMVGKLPTRELRSKWYLFAKMHFGCAFSLIANLPAQVLCLFNGKLQTTKVNIFICVSWLFMCRVRMADTALNGMGMVCCTTRPDGDDPIAVRIYRIG